MKQVIAHLVGYKVPTLPSAPTSLGGLSKVASEPEHLQQRNNCRQRGIVPDLSRLPRSKKPPDQLVRLILESAGLAVILTVEEIHLKTALPMAEITTGAGRHCPYDYQGWRRSHIHGTPPIHVEEGRPLNEYVLVVWDGAHINFGHWNGAKYVWDRIQPFDETAAARLLQHLRDDGIPLVHPLLLSERVGPTSDIGVVLLPALFDALRTAVASSGTSKTKLLFIEWRRLFGQVVGYTSDQLNDHLREISRSHDRNYLCDPTTYLFALNTYIAIVAKLVAAMALPNAAEDISNPEVPIIDRIRQIESGRLFLNAGITNMLNGDFFSWYAYEQELSKYQEAMADLVITLRGISFDVTRKTPESTRDLFKGLYMTFAPSALRHALGEYYTPDWLAAHALDTIGWQPEQSLLDPTCGSGTFLLEALRRRLIAIGDEKVTAKQLLSGMYGLDLT